MSLQVVGHVLVLALVLVDVSGKLKGIHPEVDLNFEQRVKRHGYPIEAHKLFTDDDYILTLYHIPHGLNASTTNQNQSKNKSVVLLVHGMGGSPINFVILGKERSLPYYLADRNYDVWVFCARGVKGSLKEMHRKYNWNEDKEYWTYSFHEIALYDLPATIDTILRITGQKKVSLIGHSAAGNEFFSMFSEKPLYNKKVSSVVIWASSPIFKRTDYPLVLWFSSLVDVWRGVMKYLRLTEFFPIFQEGKPLLKRLCADPDFLDLCLLSAGIVGSHKSVLQHPDDIQLIANTIPRLSNKQIFHFMDNLNNGTFRKYDYGPKKNLKIYGHPYPPNYNLSATTVPVAFFLGPLDGIVQLEDIYEAMHNIPNTVMVYKVPFAKFTHLDFIFARNASNLVYEVTYRLIKNIDDGVILPPMKPPSKYNL